MHISTFSRHNLVRSFNTSTGIDEENGRPQRRTGRLSGSAAPTDAPSPPAKPAWTSAACLRRPWRQLRLTGTAEQQPRRTAPPLPGRRRSVCWTRAFQAPWSEGSPRVARRWTPGRGRPFGTDASAAGVITRHVRDA